MLDRFLEVASRTGISAELLMLNTSFASADDRFAESRGASILSLSIRPNPTKRKAKRRLSKAHYSIQVGQ